MGTYIFKREDSNFDDLLSEVCIAENKNITKMFYKEHVIIITTFEEQDLNYLILKYGDEMINPIIDFSPVPNVDYKVRKVY